LLTDGRTDMTKLIIVAVRSFANVERKGLNKVDCRPAEIKRGKLWHTVKQQYSCRRLIITTITTAAAATTTT
jgi:hypothetical protein